MGKLYALVDDTEHYRYMEELEKQKDIADNANEAKSRFLANMSHEIRTPINAVLGMDEMILRESGEKHIRGYASDIMSAGKTLLSLINDILDFSKVEEGKMEIIPVQYELSSMINDLVNMIRGRAEKKGLSFNISVNEKIPHILFGDEIRIRQCVLNLLTNAVKYTEKGFVNLKVDFTPGKNDEHVKLKFSVEDSGIGMKPEDIEKLFSPYKRIDEKRNRNIEGTGLGMTITRQLLELMGSFLEVKSVYGEGTCVSFEVEQRIVSADEIGNFAGRLDEVGDSIEEYHELFHAPDARILVVDDTEMNLTVMQSLLKKTAVRVDTALSGRDAVNLSEVNKYDLIFIDHMMPDMDGIETLKAIRLSEKNLGTPAIALTANAVSGAREMYLEAGFNDYLSKPVDGSKLEKLMAGLLPKEKLLTPVRLEDKEEKATQRRSKVLVVDDDESVCALIESILGNSYDIGVIHTGAEAENAAVQMMPDLVLLDIHLGDANGFDIMRTFKENEQIADIPVLLVTGDNDTVTEENGFKVGASDYIRKPFVPDVLKQRVKRIIDLYHYQRSIEEEVEVQTRRSRRLAREMMITLSKTVDTKDHYTDGHSRRVAALCAEIGRRLGKNESEQVLLYEIGLLHDIGKIGVREDIIRKNTRLSDDEFAEVKSHTVKGFEILKHIHDMPKLREGARWHHERFDGSGYPDGLKGEEIPESARIACIADCYDAMTSTRTYSVPKRQEDVRAEIERCKGTWFDPAIADVMLAMIDEDKDYKMNENSSGGDIWKEYERLWEKPDDSVLGKSDVIANKGRGDAKTSAQSTKEDLPEGITKIAEINASEGLKNCGSVSGYLSVLDVFHKTAAPKADEIEGFYKNGDIENYTIKVHALKSSARIIGAEKLSQLALELENAGKEKNLPLISEKTPLLLQMYRELNAKLDSADEKSEKLTVIDEKSLKEAFQTITEVSQSMDYEMMENLLGDLKEYRLDERSKGYLEKIEGLLTNLDWDEITKTAENYLEGSEV
ncbi:MAG: response regulator [Lachnospiraceae bacterium]|nr:response regulator [Lachnospiraceae bacterium]